MDHMQAAQEAVRRKYGAAYNEIAACAAVAARTFTAGEYEEFHGDFVGRVLEYAPGCWDGDASEDSIALAYVRHLEDAVGSRAHRLGLSRHHRTCNGECS